MRRLLHRLKWWYRERYVLPKHDLELAKRILAEIIDIVQDEWEDPLQWQDLPDKIRWMKEELDKR